MSSGRSGSCCRNGMVRIESTQVENVTIIGRPSPSPTSRARNWSQPPMAPCLGTRVLSARRKWILLAEPLLRRSEMEGPPSSANADGSSTPYEILSSFSLAANTHADLFGIDLDTNIGLARLHAVPFPIANHATARQHAAIGLEIVLHNRPPSNRER